MCKSDLAYFIIKQGKNNCKQTSLVSVITTNSLKNKIGKLTGKLYSKRIYFVKLKEKANTIYNFKMYGDVSIYKSGLR